MPNAKWRNFTDDEIRKIVSESTSFSEVQRKMGYTSNSGSLQTTLKKVFEEKNIDYSHFKGHAWNRGMSEKEDSLTDFDTHTFQTIKEILFEERGHKCERCGIAEWLGEPIILQVHHIDGNHNNNVRSNLQILCPNCHSQTDSWCNQKSKNNVSDEEFLEVLKQTSNICQACRIVGLSPNQNNYKRARRLLEE